ncbi:hypothetical protein Javan139_0037 [Streptococcus phage Javan139]|uniref:hypothetical protein n=1 Tax=Streptococcus dysgalactiae TaxID=1334 RepID=UPI0010C4FD6F|nr:hypothetical protein [Streptococcus dysgalactiae]QBX14479.1 hypothetical protein Javan139_0037 [Streptococcus phage Javan139]GET83851.1 hypothetical protein KNZ16_05720 [Streptococcus dysgalactiae subsp. equisimilis]HES2724891.1 hypothetical protein [Streptococcus pyogenes]
MTEQNFEKLEKVKELLDELKISEFMAPLLVGDQIMEMVNDLHNDPEQFGAQIKLAVEFIKKALTIADYQVIMFLKIQFLETKTRQELFSTTPLKYVYVHSRRVNPMRNGSPTDEKGKPWNSAMCFAWFVWQKGYEGDPMIKFL